MTNIQWTFAESCAHFNWSSYGYCEFASQWGMFDLVTFWNIVHLSRPHFLEKTIKKNVEMLLLMIVTRAWHFIVKESLISVYLMQRDIYERFCNPQLPEQDLMNYYTVVPEMSHKDSELQVLITNGSFTWANGASQSQREVESPKTSSVETSSTGSGSSLIETDTLNGSFENHVVLPTLRRLSMQLSKVGETVAYGMILYIYFFNRFIFCTHYIMYMISRGENIKCKTLKHDSLCIMETLLINYVFCWSRVK